MGHVVDGKRVVNLGGHRAAQHHAHRKVVKSYLDGRVKVLGNDSIVGFEEALAVVRSHFGCNISDACRLSVHAVAASIRAGRMTP
jgi:hypothetical protein